jgi:hypothetical protein
MVGLGGLEPPTPRLSSVCSNQLSYRPNAVLVLCGASAQLKAESPAYSQTATCGSSNLCERLNRAWYRNLKGGDPAAGSPTATLLRLHPSH